MELQNIEIKYKNQPVKIVSFDTASEYLLDGICEPAEEYNINDCKLFIYTLHDYTVGTQEDNITYIGTVVSIEYWASLICAQ